VLFLFVVMYLGLLLAAKANALDLDNLGVIPVHCTVNTPGCLFDWTVAGGAHQTNIDVFSFDPFTRTIYIADRVNKGATAIDTDSNTYQGTIPFPTAFSVPTTGACTGSCPSGMLVAPPLHKLVMTDRGTRIAIMDLRLGAAESVLLMPLGSGSDELDYDPLNQRAYVANTIAPYELTVVDLVNDSIVTQIALPSNPEQPRFNPVDGMIYQNITDEDNGGLAAKVLKVNPATNTFTTLVSLHLYDGVHSCQPHGIDIDPVTNRAVLGCTDDAQLLLDLATGTILARFPQVTGTDVEYFNNNLRRWYTASSNNVVATDSCEPDGAGHVPVVGVFAAPGSFVEADCSALNGHGLGVDSIHNNVYVGSRRFPAGIANLDGAGVLVFHDHSALAQPGLAPETHATLSGIGKAIVHFQGGHTAEARLSGLPAGSPVLLNITTTVGNETLTCTESLDTATCHGTLLGKALIGGEVIASVGGASVASGPITLGNGGFGKAGNSE
jgi:DNA-binding beta-propeller fold protein YncE